MFILIAAFDYGFLAQKVQIAREYLEEGKPSSAYKVAKDLLKYPQYPRYYLLGRFYLAKSLLDMGYFSKAAKEFKKFEAGVRKTKLKVLYPYLDEALYYRAYSLQRSKDLEGALSLYRRLMRLYPDSFLYYGAKYRIAQIYEQKGLTEDAVKIYTELAKENAGTYSKLARRRLEDIEKEEKHRQELAEAQKKIEETREEARKKIEKLKEQARKEKEQIEKQAKTEIERRDELIVKLMDQNQDRLLENYRKEEQIDRLHGKVNQLSTEIDRLNKKIRELKNKIALKDREIQQLHSQIDDLQKQLEEGRLKKEELEKKEAEIFKRLAALEKEKSELEKEKRALEEEKKALLQAKAEEGEF